MVGCYCRVSSDEQEKEGTIENQINYAEKFFDLNNITNVKYYLDDGVSGTIPLEERPKGIEVLVDAKNGKLKVLYVVRMNRLGRLTRVTLNAIYELEKRGVVIKSMTEPFDTETPAGRYFVANLAAMAELDRANILQQLNDGKDRAARQGRWTGGTVPFGYTLNDQKYLEIYEPEAKFVRLIYKLYTEENYSSYKIAEYLNALGVPPHGLITKGRRISKISTVWTGGRVRNLIIMPVYKGVSIHRAHSTIKREPIIRNVPAIVSDEIWDNAQECLRKNQIEASRNRKYKYLLSGLVKCGLCGLSYSGTTTVIKKYVRGYYRCCGKHNDRKILRGGNRCPNRFVAQKEIEKIVWTKCVDYIKKPDEVFKEIAAMSEEPNVKTAKQEISDICKAIKDKDNEKKKILDLYRKELIEFNDVQEQLEKIKKEKEMLEKHIQEIKKEQLQIQKRKEFQNSLEKVFTKFRNEIDNADFETKREIVKTLVKKIVVYPDKINIFLRFLNYEQ